MHCDYFATVFAQRPKNATLNQHYATLLGLGTEWKVTKVDLDLFGKKIDIFFEYAPKSAICPVCGKLDMRPDFARIGASF